MSIDVTLFNIIVSNDPTNHLYGSLVIENTNYPSGMVPAGLILDGFITINGAVSDIPFTTSQIWVNTYIPFQCDFDMFLYKGDNHIYGTKVINAK